MVVKKIRCHFRGYATRLLLVALILISMLSGDASDEGRVGFCSKVTDNCLRRCQTFCMSRSQHFSYFQGSFKYTKAYIENQRIEDIVKSFL